MICSCSASIYLKTVLFACNKIIVDQCHYYYCYNLYYSYHHDNCNYYYCHSQHYYHYLYHPIIMIIVIYQLRYHYNHHQSHRYSYFYQSCLSILHSVYKEIRFRNHYSSLRQRQILVQDNQKDSLSLIHNSYRVCYQKRDIIQNQLINNQQLNR